LAKGHQLLICQILITLLFAKVFLWYFHTLMIVVMLLSQSIPQKVEKLLLTKWFHHKIWYFKDISYIKRLIFVRKNNEILYHELYQRMHKAKSFFSLFKNLLFSFPFVYLFYSYLSMSLKILINLRLIISFIFQEEDDINSRSSQLQNLLQYQDKLSIIQHYFVKIVQYLKICFWQSI
jgi:hypothetical protein